MLTNGLPYQCWVITCRTSNEWGWDVVVKVSVFIHAHRCTLLGWFQILMYSTKRERSAIFLLIESETKVESQKVVHTLLDRT